MEHKNKLRTNIHSFMKSRYHFQVFLYSFCFAVISYPKVFLSIVMKKVFQFTNIHRVFRFIQKKSLSQYTCNLSFFLNYFPKDYTFCGTEKQDPFLIFIQIRTIRSPKEKELKLKQLSCVKRTKQSFLSSLNGSMQIAFIGLKCATLQT